MTDQAAKARLTFFGTMTASLSHELKNVLATINEFAGLLEDLSVGGDPAAPPLPASKVHSISTRVLNQIKRGEALVKRLNRFAHSTDDRNGPIELNPLLGDFCDLGDRFVRLAQATLTRSFPPEEHLLELDPFALLQVLFQALRLALDELGPDRRIELVCTCSVSEGLAIRLTWPSSDRPPLAIETVRAQVGGAADLVPAAIKVFVEDGRQGISLFAPSICPLVYS